MLARTNISLPAVLAGPIIRRAAVDRVLLWIATSEPLDLGAQIYSMNTSLRPPTVNRSTPLGEGVALRRVRLGARLFIHLIAVRPRGGAGAAFPTRTILAYDILKLARAGDLSSPTSQRLADLTNIDSLRLHPFPLPTFVLQRPDRNELVALYASCRKLHGKGADAAAAATSVVMLRANDVCQRPTALFLGGDQIYADDVSDLLIRNIALLGEALQGGSEPLPSVSGSAQSIRIGGRQALLEREAFFTSTEASNHLMTFGEFAATYLFAWNPQIWPARLPDVAEVRSNMVNPPRERDLAQRHREQSRSLEDARRAGAGLRKVLANTPTYMIFDDHEITDDWNLNESWTQAVMGRPLGRRIIANGLAAYWAFQGWGNAPEVYHPTAFVDVVENRLCNLWGDASVYERTLSGFQQWSFVAPTQPRAVFMDARTGRERGRADRDWRHPRLPMPVAPIPGRVVGHAPVPVPVPRPPWPRSIGDIIPGAQRIRLQGRPAQLIGGVARNRLASLCSTLPAQQPVIFIAPAPVFGLEMIEGVQDLLSRVTGSYEFDLEHWHANPDSLLELMNLIFRLRPAPCVFLSGDVHYAFEGKGEVTGQGTTVRVGQFTSSAMKNEAPGVMGAVGFAQTVSRVRDFVSLVAQRILYWRVAGGEYHILNVTGPSDVVLETGVRGLFRRDPDLRESIDFQPLGASQFFNTVLAANNIGELRVRDGQVSHRFHFVRSGGGTGSTQEHRL